MSTAQFVDLKPYGLTVGGGQPVIAMTAGVSASLTLAGYRTVDAQASKVAELLSHARDLAQPGEPTADLYGIPLKVITSYGVSDERLWVKQNGLSGEFILLCPCEY
jgi:hypothetical protein